MNKIIIALEVDETQKEKIKSVANNRAELLFTKDVDVTDDMLSDADGIIGNIDPDLLSRHHNIKWVHLNSAGADPYLVDGVLASDCTLYNAVGAYGRSVSEHMLGLTLSITKRLHQYRSNQSKNLWNDEGEILSIEESTVVVIGLGDIGGSYARKMKALGAYVIGVRNSNRAKPDYVDEQYTIADLGNVINKADIIASVLPSTNDTRGMYNKKFFDSLKDGAFFINSGRGDAVIEDDLIEALDNGKLTAAAIDVASVEPLPSDSKLWSCDNLFITPHVAGGFHMPYTKNKIVEMVCTRLDEWLS